MCQLGIAAIWLIFFYVAAPPVLAAHRSNSTRTRTSTRTSTSTSTSTQHRARGEATSSSSSASHLSSLEKAYLEVPSPESARSNLQFITREPHVAGTLGDEIMADFVVQEFQQAGIPNVSTFDLQVYLNYPMLHKRSSLTLKQHNNGTTQKVVYEAKLSEHILEEDDTSDTVWRNHPFHGYSPPGHIQAAPMVYANYGRPEDFDLLSKAGVSVNGTVVLVRYGKCFRGLKVQNAQKRGALGVLIYSDPQQDGYGPHPGDQEGVYPDGPWRPSFGIQRGSVQFNSQCAGDPFRADPRYGNTTVQELCGVSSPQDLIPTIPSLPIGYEDAAPLLRHMGGPLAQDVGGADFCGSIRNLTYSVGPSSLSGSLLDMDVYNTSPALRSIPNVIGVIPGQLPPSQDMPVLLGNHRDAWVYGAADPNSGTAALLEVAKGLGTLYQDLNWRPLRTIYLLSWSGEEYGLLGSTGWAELNTGIMERAMAYLNVDTVVSGDSLKAQASPLLTTLWKEVMNDWNETMSHQLYDVNSGREWTDDDDDVGVLGSGSDFTVFLDHFAIPSLDFSFEKRSGTYGQYHSIYDSFDWMDKFGGRPNEPGSAWELMANGAKIWGLLALRLANSVSIPLDPIAQGSALFKYAKAIETQKLSLDVSSIHQAVKKYQKAAAQLQLKCQPTGHQVAASRLLDQQDDCNEKLGLVERQFLLAEGLPKRPWFQHSLQAPGMFLGYAAEAFPGVQQAIDDKDLDLAQQQIAKVAERIEAAAEFLKL
jgi:hypothetical protein